MQRLAILVFVVVAVGSSACGGSTTTSGATTYALPGIQANTSVPAGGCIIVNAVPQQLPSSTVSYTLTGFYSTDSWEVGVLPSNYTCQFNPNNAFVDDIFVGSASDSASVPAGTYDLDVICQNTVADCVLSSITWSATY